MNRHALFRLGSFALIAFIVGGATMFGILPKWAEIQANTATLNQVTAQLNREEAELGKIIELVENRVAFENELAALKAAIPEDLAISDFVKSMNIISSRHQLDITSFSVGDPRDYVAPEFVEKDPATGPNLSTVSGGAMQTINVDLSVSGDEQSLLSFLDDVQKMQRANLVYSISLTDRDREAVSVLAVSFEIFILR